MRHMSGGDIALILTGIGGLLGTIGTLVQARASRRAGVSSDERQARRDEIKDRDDWISKQDRRIASLEDEVEGLKTALREGGRRLDAVESIAARRALHIDLLEYRGWVQRGETPPPRPDGV